MKKGKTVVQYTDLDGKTYVYFFDSYFIANDLAVTFDGELAVLERLRPSRMYPGCYELTGRDYMEFEISPENLGGISAIDAMEPVELLCQLIAKEREKEEQKDAELTKGASFKRELRESIREI